jgi:hypothetical protein
MQMAFTNGIHEAIDAIPSPINGILKPMITLAMQKVIGTPITRNGIAD